MSKWIIGLGVTIGAGLLLSTQSQNVIAQVRAALVQDVLMQGFQPVNFFCTESQFEAPTTRVSCTTGPVPPGKRLVVEHMSGEAVIDSDDVIDQLFASGGGGTVHLPLHLSESRLLGCGPTFGICQTYQFGSPVKTYVRSGQTITMNVDASRAGRVQFSVQGYLVNE
jgi:hypothetical protein